MRNGSTRFSLILALLFVSQFVFAQANDGGSPNITLIVIMIVVVVIALAVIVQVADSMIRIEANKSGVDTEKANMSLLPRLKEFFSPKKPAYVGATNFHSFKKGFDIKLEGAASGKVSTANVSTFAVQPPNFRGIAPIPKLTVAVGDNVKAGDQLFFDKSNPDINFPAPVSGEIIAINRGERRSITEVVILADKEQQYRELPEFDLENGNREELVQHLFATGAWPLLRQRPFDVMASPNEVPDNIFISTFDTAPLAPDLNVVVEGRGEAFQKGLDVLKKLTNGKVYLGLDGNSNSAPSSIFTEAKGVEKNYFQGKHPSGNVGVQIHHTAPITTKSMVWTLGVQEVITLGSIFTEGKYIAERVVALTGAQLNEPKYVRTHLGANIGDLLKGNIAGENVRIISGDVLSGQKKGTKNFIDTYDDQITVIEEGDYYEMFGWLLAAKSVPSASKSLPSALFKDTAYPGDTNTHGEKRAFVVTGQYESVLPMDIYPQYLMKAVLTNDYEKMEGLGIHELVEEDIAICEFVCTSKQPLQQILRTGLDMMNEQG